MTAFATVSSAVEAMRIGAGDYLTKPFAVEDLKTVHRAGGGSGCTSTWRAGGCASGCGRRRGWGIWSGESPEMEKLYRILSKVAFSTHPVLILGESGTGKEMVARSIHSNGPNAAKPFVPVDCGALVPALIESELFGYVKGALHGGGQGEGGVAGVGAGRDGLSG